MTWIANVSHSFLSIVFWFYLQELYCFVLFLLDKGIFFPFIVCFVNNVWLLDFLLKFYVFFLFLHLNFSSIFNLSQERVWVFCFVLFFPGRLPGCSNTSYGNVYFPPLIVLATFIICHICLGLFRHRYDPMHLPFLLRPLWQAPQFSSFPKFRALLAQQSD